MEGIKTSFTLTLPILPTDDHTFMVTASENIKLVAAYLVSAGNNLQKNVTSMKSSTKTTKTIFHVILIVVSMQIDSQAQNLSRSQRKIPWVKEKISPGLHLKSIHTNAFFNSRQYINVLTRKSKRTLSFGYEVRDLKTTSQLAEEHHALAAINAGFFDMKAGGSVTFMKVDDIVISENRDSNARITRSCFAIDEKNRLKILPSVDTAWLSKKENFDHVPATGPLLMINGKLQIEEELPRDRRHPRTCICTRRSGQVLMVTVDGRNDEANGMTLFELAQLMQIFKCQNAINLDGGGSTTMWIDGKGIVNHPSDNKEFDAQGERKVANILIVH